MSDPGSCLSPLFQQLGAQLNQLLYCYGGFSVFFNFLNQILEIKDVAVPAIRDFVHRA